MRCLSAAALYSMRRELEATQEQSEAEIAISDEQGFALYKAYGISWRGWALAMQGRQEEGIAQIRQALSAALDTGQELSLSSFLALLADACGEAGQPEEGLTALTEAFDLVSKTQEHLELYRLKGQLLLIKDLGNVAEAERCLRTAIDVARRQGARLFELRSTVSLARVLATHGKGDKARPMLAEIYDWFTEGFDTADLKDAKALLEELAR
jgi:predicted ATPase